MPQRAASISPIPRRAHEIVVRQAGLRWEVSVDRLTRPRIDWLCTRDRAIDHALELGQDLVSTPHEVVHIVVRSGAPFECWLPSPAPQG